MKLGYICIAALLIAVAFTAFAETVKVTEIEDNRHYNSLMLKCGIDPRSKV